MKIAKKLLAAVVAVMLVCSLAVSAFATSSATPKVVLESDWVIDEDGYITVNVFFVDSVGVGSWDFAIEFDTEMLTYDAAYQDGEDAAQVNQNGKTGNNKYDMLLNMDGNKLLFSGYFLDTLWTAEEFKANSAKGKQCIVNSDKFHALTLWLLVEDVDAYNAEGTEISIDGILKIGKKDMAQTPYSVSDAIDNLKAPATEPETEPKTEPETEPKTEPETEPKTEPETEPKTEPETDPETEPDTQPGPIVPPCDDDDNEGNDTNMGDSAVLAAAAGVVLLLCCL